VSALLVWTQILSAHGWAAPPAADKTRALTAAAFSVEASAPPCSAPEQQVLPSLRSQPAGFGAPVADASAVAPRWLRGLLVALAVVVVVAAGGSKAARAESDVGVFFGQGCFWHVQHEVVKKEISFLGRDGSSVTALVGYAGGTKVGDKGRVCYHNIAMAPDYGSMGHTEVVNVKIPESKLGEFAKDYLDEAAKSKYGRHDPQDRGTEYRSAIGLPGGMDSPLFKQIEAANEGRLQLLRGMGNDEDTVGTKKVWVYDSDKFPFYQGEIYHQFHDDMADKYGDKYHKMKDSAFSRGSLKSVECPELGF